MGTVNIAAELAIFLFHAQKAGMKGTKVGLAQNFSEHPLLLEISFLHEKVLDPLLGSQTHSHPYTWLDYVQGSLAHMPSTVQYSVYDID